MLDIQKASLYKRIGAYFFDLIVMVTVVVLVAWLLSWGMGFEAQFNELESYYDKYEQQIGIDTQEYWTKENPTEEETKKYEELIAALDKDEDAIYALSMVVYMGLTILSSSVLIGHLLLEIVIPLLFKHGRTLGKKIFGLCVMHKEGVRISVIQVIFRALLGKCTVETMLPLLAFLLFMTGVLGVVGLAVPVIVLMIQAFILLFSQHKCAIHDKLCNTVVVEYASQMIFDSVEEMIAYKEAYSAEMASRQDY